MYHAGWHHLQVMEFYCESCETAMCLECTEGEHREHVTVPLRDVLEQHKSVLKNQLDTVRNRYKEISETSFQSIVDLRILKVFSFWQTTSADCGHRAC